MAALDRQHPRDLFDIHELLINEGVEPELMNALVIYLCLSVTWLTFTQGKGRG